MMLHARGSAGAAAAIERVRAHIQAIDPELPIGDARPLSDETRTPLLFLEMASAGLFIFGIAGMALAAMGIYGLVSYTVKQSTHEIGIRMALGARSLGVVWQFLQRGLRLGAIGLVIGTAAALALTRLLGGVHLRRERDRSRFSFAGALAVVLGGVIVATVIPAWRAARTPPLMALRRGRGTEGSEATGHTEERSNGLSTHKKKSLRFPVAPCEPVTSASSVHPSHRFRRQRDPIEVAESQDAVIHPARGPPSLRASPVQR